MHGLQYCSSLLQWSMYHDRACGSFVCGEKGQTETHLTVLLSLHRVQVACSFSCADKVLAVAMSSCASSHALIAVGDKQQGLVLADIASGAFTHTLDGHRYTMPRQLMCRLHNWLPYEQQLVYQLRQPLSSLAAGVLLVGCTALVR
jgi:hypothetical protein